MNKLYFKMLQGIAFGSSLHGFPLFWATWKSKSAQMKISASTFLAVLNSTASCVFFQFIPPLLSAGAPDATGSSLSGGPFPLPGRRVSCLGGPQLVRPMLLLNYENEALGTVR